jgi:hypothetical protein
MDQRVTTPDNTGKPANVTDDTRAHAVVPPRRPPPMRVVTKGWWTLEEGTADIEDLRQGVEHE